MFVVRVLRCFLGLDINHFKLINVRILQVERSEGEVFDSDWLADLHVVLALQEEPGQRRYFRIFKLVDLGVEETLKVIQRHFPGNLIGRVPLAVRIFFLIMSEVAWSISSPTVPKSSS